MYALHTEGGERERERDAVMIERLKINTSTGETTGTEGESERERERENDNDMFYTNITDYHRSPLYLTSSYDNQNDSIDHIRRTKNLTNKAKRYSILIHRTRKEKRNEKTSDAMSLEIFSRSLPPALLPSSIESRTTREDLAEDSLPFSLFIGQIFVDRCASRISNDVSSPYHLIIELFLLFIIESSTPIDTKSSKCIIRMTYR